MRIGIAGLGLVGGSLGLALRLHHDVIAFDPAGTGEIAAAEDLAGLLPAELVIIATPLDTVVPTLAALAPLAGTAVLLDVGSVKREVARFAETAPAAARIVGGHPMAGSTVSGLGAARADLFTGRPFLLIPTARSDDAAMALAGEIARAVGAVPTVLSAELHDRAVARLSGLPLLIARALATAGAEFADLAGPGFTDMTRLAGTPKALAEAMLAGNADQIRVALREFRVTLDAAERELG
ncbi:MAG TPA: prephenate dehydrogenase/arogenate dehydrogenase family protein [Candidatus Saccharimonadales bacterium]|nr:prephenate dehydrogenase/arogenate dehydrogenase family protein [Candidatus Saccharimonadales bacterium]